MIAELERAGDVVEQAELMPARGKDHNLSEGMWRITS
jgi:hypothetical protein